jgi:hypothetical protein
VSTSAEPKDPLGNGHNLPLRAKGEFEGYSWEFRGDISGDSARDWVEVRGPTGGGSGGGRGALPFADLGWRVLSHIGSFGWSSGGWSRTGFMRRAHHPGTIRGVISADVSKLVVRFKDGKHAEAQLLESGQEDLRFFFLIHKPKREWDQIIALDTQGDELDRADHREFPRNPR